MKLVSIILPCYNHADYVDDCLKSLCDQTYPDIEILLTDDCSRDDSYTRLLQWRQRLEERFCRVVIRKNEENQGVVKSLNAMLEDCRGDYIKVLATDDMLMPNAIAEYVAFARETDCDIVLSNAYRFDAQLHYPIAEPASLSPVYAQPPQWGNDLTGKLLTGNFICAPACFMPRRTIEKYGLYDPAYIMEDYEYWLRISLSGTFRYLDKCLVFYRSSPNSMSHFSTDKAQHQRFRNFYLQTLAIFQKYEQYASKTQKAAFFNRQLGYAAGLGNKALMAEILASMKKQALPVSPRCQLILLLSWINIYPLLRKTKHLLMRR